MLEIWAKLTLHPRSMHSPKQSEEWQGDLREAGTSLSPVEKDGSLLRPIRSPTVAFLSPVALVSIEKCQGDPGRYPLRSQRVSQILPHDLPLDEIQSIKEEGDEHRSELDTNTSAVTLAQ